MTGLMTSFMMSALSSSLRNLFIVLRGDDHGIDALPGRPPMYSMVTWDLPSGRRKSTGAVLADFGELERELVRELDRHGHEFGGLVAGVAEHHALVAGAAGIDAHGDVGGLLVDAGNHAAGVGVEAVDGVVVADGLRPRRARGSESPRKLGGDFAGDDDQAGAGEGLTGDAAGRVFTQAASRMASEIWSAILSGWPSVTDSEVNRKRLVDGKLVSPQGNF